MIVIWLIGIWFIDIWFIDIWFIVIWFIDMLESGMAVPSRYTPAITANASGELVGNRNTLISTPVT